MPTIGPDQWLDLLEREYLSAFVTDGGSAVKFAVSLDEGGREYLETQVADRALKHGYLAARVSADDTKVHMADQIFFRVAEQIPWQLLARRVVAHLAEKCGYSVPVDGHEPLLPRIADTYGLEADFVLMRLNPMLNTDVFRRRELSRDFRVAMTHLCNAELSGGVAGATANQVLTDWLTGKNRFVSAAKPYQIFTRIDRTNARFLFESLLRWIRFAGYPGLVVVLDISRITLARNPRNRKLYYTKAAVLDAYEVLRQLIDGTDRLHGCLVVALPDIEFLDDDNLGRGIGAYQALKFRVFDEVHDRNLVNPMAAMVRLSTAAVGGPL